MLAHEIQAANLGRKSDVFSPERLQPLDVEHMPQIENLFFNVFRAGKGARAGFKEYFTSLFLDDAYGGSGLGSFDAPGKLGAAIAFFPMRYRIFDDVVTAKLVCAFMADRRFPRAATRMVMFLRARHHDLLFTDSGSHDGVGHSLAGGGMVLPLQSLDWHCHFKPISAFARKLRFPTFVDGTLYMVDRAVQVLRPRAWPQKEGEISEIRREEFAALVPPMIAHFKVRPDWSTEELVQLLTLAEQNRSLGDLRYFAVTARSGNVIGGLAAYFGPRQSVRVLELVAQPGAEGIVAASMLADLRAQGVAMASGGVQPHLVGALAPHRGITFRHRSFCCLATRFESVKTAIARNEIYMGGLAGEGWSRLMTDFF